LPNAGWTHLSRCQPNAASRTTAQCITPESPLEFRIEAFLPLRPRPGRDASPDERGLQKPVFGTIVVSAKADAPEFLKEKVGAVLNQWPHPDGWFDA
jgi:hypothetical protein